MCSVSPRGAILIFVVFFFSRWTVTAVCNQTIVICIWWVYGKKTYNFTHYACIVPTHIVYIPYYYHGLYIRDNINIYYIRIEILLGFHPFSPRFCMKPARVVIFMEIRQIFITHTQTRFTNFIPHYMLCRNLSVV